MDRFFRSRTLFVILMLSLSMVQAYVVHASQTLYTEISQNRHGDNNLMADYWRYHP